MIGDAKYKLGIRPNKRNTAVKLTDKRRATYVRMFKVARTVLDGETYQKASHSVGLKSAERSRQIVLRLTRLAAGRDEDVRNKRGASKDIRENRLFWLKRLEVLERELLGS